MLRIYAAGENIDKERFIYENISGETLVIVPDQYTLVAEEQALKYMGTDCLFDTEIISMSRLGLRILTEKGTESVRMLDRYGRFMLLTRIIKEHREDFDVFRRSAGKQAFTEMVSDFISEFKQQDCTFDEVAAILDDNKADPILRSKLEELRGVAEAYEREIQGKVTDSEDYINMYIDAVAESELVQRSSFWIYGYDSITPKFTRTMLELAKRAKSVNFILNRSNSDLDESVRAMLAAECHREGVQMSCEEIGSEYEPEKSETIRRLERGLRGGGLTEAELRQNESFAAEDLTVVCAANPYNEAESAAAYIWHLIRDCGYRMSDIQVIANDEGSMHPVIKRVFAEYGLPVFMDSARNITDTAPVGFIVDMLWFLVRGMNSKYLFAMLKTGLAGVPSETTEDLENYARTYHIRGSMWERDFKYGAEALGEENFAELNGVRGDIVSRITALRDIAGASGKGARARGRKAAQIEEPSAAASADNAAEAHAPERAADAVAGTQCNIVTYYTFIEDFKAYLEDEWHLSDAVEELVREAEAAGADYVGAEDMVEKINHSS